MPRADPKKSAYCASRHLLHHLEDASELRRNSLVSDCFATHNMSRFRPANEDREALVAINLRVQKALVEAFAGPPEGLSFREVTRAHAVLLRCDMQGQSRVVVADELNISLRQLQTARRLGHHLFLRSLLARHVPAEVRTSQSSLAIFEAVELAGRGEPRAALESLRTLVVQASDSEATIEALCEQADIEVRSLAFDRAAQLLEQARGLASRLPVQSANDSIAACRIGLVQSKLDRFLGRVDSSGLPCALPEAMRIGLERVDASRNLDASLVLARLLIFSIDSYSELGLFNSARIAEQRASKLLARTGTHFGSVPLELLIAQTRLSSAEYKDIALVSDAYREVSRLATNHGYIDLSLQAEASLATVEVIAGHITPRTFRKRATWLLREVDRRGATLSNHARLIIMDQLCDGSAAIDTPERTLFLAGKLSTLAPVRSHDASFVRTYKSLAMARLGRHAEAEALALERVEDSRRLKSLRILAGAKLFLAASLSGRGCTQMASHELDEAFPLLSRFGTGWVLKQAEVLRLRLERGRSRVFAF